MSTPPPGRKHSTRYNSYNSYNRNIIESSKIATKIVELIKKNQLKFKKFPGYPKHILTKKNGSLLSLQNLKSKYDELRAYLRNTSASAAASASSASAAPAPSNNNTNIVQQKNQNRLLSIIQQTGPKSRSNNYNTNDFEPNYSNSNPKNPEHNEQEIEENIQPKTTHSTQSTLTNRKPGIHVSSQYPTRQKGSLGGRHAQKKKKRSTRKRSTRSTRRV